MPGIPPLQNWEINEIVGRQTSTHLCDVLNKVFAEWESAAYEPHGNHMVGQGHDILVEPDVNGRNKQVRVCLCV